MREKDLREVSRSLEEVEAIYAAGYDPVYAYGKALWLKRHWGSLHTHQGVLQEIANERRTRDQ